MIRTILLFLIALPLTFTPVMVSANAGILGEWRADNNKTRIKIFPCVDDGETFCSVITWLQTPRKDVNNENPELRERDLIGVEVAKNMKPKGKNKWVGEVYSAKQGKTFASSVSLDGEVLKIKGCLSKTKVLCKTEKFFRYVNNEAAAQ